MSLIEEALRRLQDPSLPPPKQAGAVKPGPAPPTPTTLPPQPQSAPIHPASGWVHSWPTAASSASAPTPTSPTPWALIALVAAVLILTIALLVGGAWWIGRTLNAGSRPVVPARDADLQQPTPSAQEPSPVPATNLQAAIPIPESSLVISGVVEGEGEPYAVINGTIVAVGERIGAFTLEEITNGAARLRRADGSETILRVPR